MSSQTLQHDTAVVEQAGPSSFPSDAIRGRFSDGGTPEITRKITACAACRKQKIKCHIPHGRPPCSRCKKRGLPCAINKSLQTLLESDIVWKDSIEQKVARLESLYDRIAHQLPSAESALENAADEPRIDSGPDQVASEHRLHSWAVVMDRNEGPGVLPGSVVSPVGIGETMTTRHNGDIIARGILSAQEAQTCLDKYQDRLDHFLYGIVGERRTLDQIRSSSLLLAAICAVGSLHLAWPSFERLHQEFVAAASAQTFSKRNTIDDVRAFCIAAFWLSSISWSCISNAVRISTEIQLHCSIFRALEGSELHYQRTRLWPPMIPVCDAVRASAAFLDTEYAIEDDFRLVSQVRFWQVGAQVYDSLGVNIDMPLSLLKIEQLRQFVTQFDSIRAEWSQRFLQNQYVGNYPRKGVGLHHHFAKLFLFSHAFRGIGQPGFRSSDTLLEIDELANAAMLSATAIVKSITTDTEIQSFLNGLPTYFDLMIAFAVVFVLKVSTRHTALVQVDRNDAFNMIRELVQVLKAITATMHPQHLLANIARGSELLLHRCTTNGLESYALPCPRAQYEQIRDTEPVDPMAFNWDDILYGNFDMNDLDIFADQATLSGF